MRVAGVEFEDMMVAGCNPGVMDADVLYTYAGTAARDQLSIIDLELSGETVFAEAVAACLTGDAEAKAEASTAVDRVLVRLSKESLSDKVSLACRSVRACVHFEPGSAALGAGISAAAAQGNTKTNKRDQKELLRTVFLEGEAMKSHRSKGNSDED